MLGTLYFDGFAEEILPGAQLGAMADMYAEGFNDGRDLGLDSLSSSRCLCREQNSCRSTPEACHSLDQGAS